LAITLRDWSKRSRSSAKERGRIKVYGINELFTCTVAAPEEPGEFFFAPIAALIPAAARLMLALLERRVTDMGGTYASCDTDSMTVVATETGGHLAKPGVNCRKDFDP
jgi:hypothetical protein